MIKAFIKNIVLPLSDAILDRKIYFYYKFLLKSQYWSKEQLEEYQLKGLIKIINHSFKNVPYYTNLFKRIGLHPLDIKNITDIKNIPILTKNDIRNNFPDLISKDLNPKSYYSISSSGSTGEPITYYISKEAYSFNIACNLRGLSWGNFNLGDKNIKLSMNPRNTFEKRFQDILNRTLYLSARELDSKSIEYIYKSIVKYKPYLIYTYPQMLSIVADYIKSNNLIPPYVPMVNTTATNLLITDRNMIEKVFNSKVFDSYSCEGTPMISECNTHQCYHAAMEYGITEIINENEYASTKRIGRNITTDLHNYSFPFIRYDTQDLLEYDGIDCSCGRKLQPIKKIHGRVSEIVNTPSGKKLLVEHFVEYFEYEKNIEQFQVYQSNSSILEFRLVVKSGFCNADANRIVNYWMLRLNNEMKIKVKIVENISSFNSGKRRIVIRED